MRSTAPYTDLGGDQLIEWGGALRWLAAGERVDPGEGARVGGVAGRPCDAVSRPRQDRRDVFHPLDATLAALHRKLKAVFDPHGVFNRGRLRGRPLMQTNLAPEYRDTHDGREADAILRSCVHCGFCTATCPTYQLLGDELDGPRGRIYLIKQVLEGAPVTAKTQLHLDRCLTCRNCETTCPSGVQYGRLIDIGRRLVDAKVGRTSAEARAALDAAPHAPVANAVRRRADDGPPGEGPAAARARRPHPGGAEPAGAWPAPRHARKMLIMEGCVQPSLKPNIDAACARVLDRIGITPLRVPGGGCCGALSHHLIGRRRGARRSSAATSTRGGRSCIAASRRSSSPPAAAA